MPLSALNTFCASPYARSPVLLARKVRDRLGLRRAFDFEEAPAGLRARPCRELAAALRAWAAACDLGDAPYPRTRVFRQDFDETALLRICRNGPEPRGDLLGDVKLAWEFSRSQPLVLNVVRGLDADGAAFARTWLDANGDARGPAWSNAMEVALRAVSWVSADALLDGALQCALGEALWLRTLWNHARAIETQLEARLVPSNHYLANLLGLVFLGRHLDNRGLARTARWAADEMEAAVLAQTRADGGAYEGSLPYHALVTEMALLYALLAGDDAGLPFLERLAQMAQVVADFSERGDDVLPVGDDDGGRVIPLDFVSRSLGRADILLRLAEQVLGRTFERSAQSMCPDSGWWIARRGAFTAFLEFGGVGFRGRGGHAHNDDLSVCCAWRGRRVFTDPGSYLYTPSPEERNRFRGASAHNVVIADGVEQRPLPAGSGGALFLLPGPDAALPVLEFGADRIASEREQAGGRWRREVRVGDDGVRVRDRLAARGRRAYAWRFHLDPAWSASVDGAAVTLRDRDGHALVLRAEPALELRLERCWISPFYGTKVESSCICGGLSAEGDLDVAWSLLESR